MAKNANFQIFERKKIFELNGKGHEPSQAENTSAQVMAQACSAWTHYYLVIIKWGVRHCRKPLGRCQEFNIFTTVGCNKIRTFV